MPNRYDPTLKQPMQQHAPHVEQKPDMNQEYEEQSDSHQSGKSGSERAENVAKGIRKWILYILGAEYLRKIDFRKNRFFILMIVVMVILLVYLNLLTLSRQKRLENLDKERIELNDKYTQIMEKREALYVDTSQHGALLEVFREKGFVDDSSLVYDIYEEGKEQKR